MDKKNQTIREHNILVIKDKKNQVIVLRDPVYTIGRSQSNSIVIQNDIISRQHAVLLRVPTSIKHNYQYKLMDGNTAGKPSVNGIFVNGECREFHDLSHGDKIAFAASVEALYLTVTLDDAGLENFLASFTSGDFPSNQMKEIEALVNCDNRAESQSFLAMTDPTSIMLGVPA